MATQQSCMPFDVLQLIGNGLEGGSNRMRQVCKDWAFAVKVRTDVLASVARDVSRILFQLYESAHFVSTSIEIMPIQAQWMNMRLRVIRSAHTPNQDMICVECEWLLGARLVLAMPITFEELKRQVYNFLEMHRGHIEYFVRKIKADGCNAYTSRFEDEAMLIEIPTMFNIQNVYVAWA
jgi:hypothetical protein